MERRLELLETTVSQRTRWHTLVLYDGQLVGLGECSDTGWLEDLTAALTSAVPALEDTDLERDREAIVATLVAGVQASTPEQRLRNATVLGGLEQALVDLAAQRAGQPVWKWLGASSPDPIPLYANINRMPGDKSPAALGQRARQAVADGFTAVKCAPFDAPDSDRDLADLGLARVRAVREAVGDDVQVKVDCHTRLSLEELFGILPALEVLGIDWLEDAVLIGDLDGLRDVRRATSIPLAGGELVFDAAEALPAVAARLVDVVMPDVKHVGGVGRVLDLAREASDVAVSPHNPSGPVATAASAHAYAACPNVRQLELQYGEAAWRPDLVDGRERIERGHLHLGDEPGLGVRLPPEPPHSRVVWSTSL